MKGFAKVLSIIIGIIMIACGFYCLFNPGLTYLSVGYVVGLSMIIDAVGRFINWREEKKAGVADGWMLVGAILSAVLGFFVLNSAALQLGIDAFIVYYIAVWLLCYGIIVIVRAWQFRKLHKNLDTKMLGTHWFITLILGILLCVFGVLSMIKPLVMASTIGLFIGLGIISAGADMITLATTPVK